MNSKPKGRVPVDRTSEAPPDSFRDLHRLTSGRHLKRLLVGAISGGFVARLALELSGRPWPWPVILVVAGALICAGSWLVLLLGRRIDRARFYWPLPLLSVYLLWPQRRPLLAVQLLLLIGLVILLERSRRINFAPWPVGRFVDILTFTISLCFYFITTAPGVLPADSGEFQIVAPLLGVAHPPGYPLYTLLGWLFTRLIPFGTAAYRLNLMSAFFAAGTVTLLGATTRRWAGHLGAPRQAALVGGLASALTLGTATTVWAQATVANIRMPTVLATALGLYALASYVDASDQPQADRALGLLALALGLGIGHHPSLVFIGVFIVLYLVLIDPRLLLQPRRWWKPLLIGLLALLPLVYLPVRGAANAALAPPDLTTWDGFVHHVTAQGFEGDMFAFANAQDLPPRLTLLPTLFLFQFNLSLLALAALGLLLLAGRDWRLLLLLGGGLVLHTFVSITYRAPQTVEYMMPAYLPIAILIGFATAWLLSPLSGIQSRFGALLAAVVLLAGLANGLDHGPSYLTLARDRSTRHEMQTILDQAAPGTLVLADWHWATPLWYLQKIEGQRPDVKVSYVYPIPGQTYADTWRERIDEAVGERPVVLTRFYDLPDYTLEPLGRGFTVHQRPFLEVSSATHKDLERVPPDTLFGTTDSGVRLLGYRLSRWQPRPGGTVEMILVWQAVGRLAVPPSFSVKLLSPDGDQLAQSDRYLGVHYEPGEIRYERLVLPIYTNIPPGGYSLTLEVYNASQSGFDTWPLQQGGTRIELATLSIRPGTSPPVSLHPVRIHFADGPTLVGVDYDRSLPATLRLYLHWRGPASGGEQIVVEGQKVALPALSGGAYQTVALDLAGGIQGRPSLTLTDANGQELKGAGPWGWPLQQVSLPIPSPTARFVPLMDEMALIGVSPSADASPEPSDDLEVRLTFLALKPLVNDDMVSVRLWDETGQLRQMHDLQPALGAIPTLKWIRGSRIIDTHSLVVPQDIAGHVVRATLVVYEQFRGTPLLPLDSRMERIPLGEWELQRR